MSRIELTRSPALKKMLISRWPQLAVFGVMLAAYIFAIMAGWLGTPVGSRNFSVVFVWIAWWALLILIAVPFLGRGWCSICPIPLPGEWLQRGAVLGPGVETKKSRWPNLRWPKPLRNIWLQNGAFLMLALFSSVLLTTPAVTAIVLAGMMIAAIGLSMVFERRAFCRYLCPVSGFIGLYAQTAPLELRIKDKPVCVACKGKPCYNGNQNGYGCPWDVFPGGLTKNTYCGLCLECLRTCPQDNIAINLRRFGSDLAQPTKRMDEAFKAFIMLSSAMIYAAVLLGPWGRLKDAAYGIGSGAWFLYALTFLVTTFIVLPGLFALGLNPTQGPKKLKPRFAALSTALIPLGLMFWIAFSLSFVLTNASYILSSLSDPLGLGWNLFGAASNTWQPLFGSMVAPLQTLVLVGGLVWAAFTARKAATKATVSPTGPILFSGAATLTMLWLLI